MNAQPTLPPPESLIGSAPASSGAAAERPLQPESVPLRRDFSARATSLQNLLQPDWLDLLTKAWRDQWRDRFNPSPGGLRPGGAKRTGAADFTCFGRRPGYVARGSQGKFPGAGALAQSP